VRSWSYCSCLVVIACLVPCTPLIKSKVLGVLAIWLLYQQVLEKMGKVLGSNGHTWLCPCTNTAPSFSDYMTLNILSNSSASSADNNASIAHTNATVPQITNCTLPSGYNGVDTFGSPEFSCFCEQYVKHFSDHWYLVPPGPESDLAMKGCVLIMRGLLSPTYTRRSVSFVESPVTAQIASAIAARSAVLAAGVPFSTLIATTYSIINISPNNFTTTITVPNVFYCIEALTVLMSSVYQVMVNDSYLPQPSEYWDLGTQNVSSDVTVPYDQLLAFPSLTDNQTSDAVYLAAMPVVNFSWPGYLMACDPPYCDVVKHNSAGYRAFLAFSAFGGIWTAVFVIVKTLVWPF